VPSAAYIAGTLSAQHLLKLSAEYAPGIPEDRKIHPLPEIKKPQTWRLAIQEHDAETAGKHFDLRLVDPASGHAHSWALPAARLPEPGKSVLAVPQPTHTSAYALNFGKNKPEEIAEGYGKGTVRMHTLTDTEVYHAKPEESDTRLRFNVYKSTGPEEYALVRTSDGNDRLVNKTLSRARVPHLDIGSKPKLKELDITKLDLEDANSVLMPKYDGAHTLLDLPTPERIPRLFSYREPKRHPAGVIEHTHKVPALLTTRVPKEIANSTLRVETIGVGKDGKAIPAKDIAGMLNASVVNSRARQEEMGANLKNVIFDISRYRGKDVSTQPFTDRLRMMREIGSALKMDVAETAHTPEEKRNLLDAITSGKHPMTTEGVIVRHHDKPEVGYKAKIRPDHDVYVRKIFEATDAEGQGKGRAGGFEYSWTPRGPVVGRVGTGFTHTEATDMLKNQHDYLGRVAKVEAETKYPSGALSKASFREWHLEKGVG